jgi:hypothetical protein
MSSIDRILKMLIDAARLPDPCGRCRAAPVHPWILLVAMLGLALSACEEPASNDVDPPADSAATGVAGEPPVDTAAPGTMPAEGAITFQGFGPAAFGADPEQVRIAWGGDLNQLPPEPPECYYLMPRPPPSGGYRIAFMIEGGRFSRIDVRAGDIVAPGGGRVGMSAEEIEALYPGRIEQRPHKYVEDGKYLRIPDEEGGDGVLLFATDGNGNVTEWRIGVPPQVDYVEGCS